MSFISDLRFAMRTLMRRPTFSITAVLTLALGVGANSAVFSVVDGVLWRPLSYSEPEQLVALWPNRALSTRDVVFLREHGEGTFASVAFVAGWTMALTGVDSPTQVYGARVSANVFETLGTQPLLGRTFVPADRANGASPVVMLSHRTWTTRYGGDSAIVGQSATIDGSQHEIVGVMPPDFQIFNPLAELWVPLPFVEDHWTYTSNFSRVIARLEPGVSTVQAQEVFRQLLAGIKEAYGLADAWGESASVSDLRENLVGGYRVILWVLLGAVSFILLIAGSNLSNLMLVKAAANRGEFALRAVLGATRARLLQIVAMESLVLSIVGGSVGLALAFGGVELLQRLVPPDTPRMANVAIDLRVLLVCFGVAITTGLLFSALPLWLTTQSNLKRDVGQSRVVGDRGGAALRSGWVSAQIALAVVLIVGASLMIETVRGLLSVDPGFDEEQVLTLRLQPAGASYDEAAEFRAFYDELFDRIRGLPSVTRVGAIQHLPLSGWEWGIPFEFADAPIPDNESKPILGHRIITGDYFETMRIPVLQGRLFTPADNATTERVAVVSRSFVQRHRPDRPILGEHLRLGRNAELVVTVVGVVGDVHHASLDQPPEPEVYLPLSQASMPSMMVAVRTSTDPERVASSVQTTVWSIDSDVPISHVMTMRELVRTSLASVRLVMTLLSLFAGVAMVLGGVGVYGVTSFIVSRRTGEIGIRKALGATDGRVRQQVLKRGMTSAVVGTLVGLVVAGALGRLMTDLIYEVRPTDPIVLLVVSIVMLGVAAVACAVPAWRATLIDPAAALRNADA